MFGFPRQSPDLYLNNANSKDSLGRKLHIWNKKTSVFRLWAIGHPKFLPATTKQYKDWRLCRWRHSKHLIHRNAYHILKCKAEENNDAKSQVTVNHWSLYWNFQGNFSLGIQSSQFPRTILKCVVRLKSEAEGWALNIASDTYTDQIQV
jgi:hypothetical protein